MGDATLDTRVDGDMESVRLTGLTMTTGDGRQGTRTLGGDKPPADGVYRDSISRLEEPGQYQLELEMLELQKKSLILM